MIHARAYTELFAAIVLLLIMIASAQEDKKNSQNRVFVSMLFCNFLALVSEAAVIALYGTPGIENFMVFLNTVSLVSGYGILYCYIGYVYVCISYSVGKEIETKAMKLMGWLFVLAILTLVLGTQLGVLYEIRDGVFIMKPLFMLTFWYELAGITVTPYLLIKYRKFLSLKDSLILLSLPVFSIGTLAVQYILIGKTTLTYMVTMLACLSIYLMIQSDRMKRMAIQRQQMEELHTQLLISQIQPHFIFNSLSSIRRLIRKDQDIAVEAVEKFSLYLRENLDSMNSSLPVLFLRELEHTKQYLYMEKLRFGDRLSIEYQINCSNFLLPILTLQPIVENAVKHGVLEKIEGGKIWIITEETKNDFVVTVRDNGVGFDPEMLKTRDDGKTHVGISNVRLRLKLQINGSLTISSIVGEGTEAVIRIPKK